jgi:hypothetical protein
MVEHVAVAQQPTRGDARFRFSHDCAPVGRRLSDVFDPADVPVD